MVTMEVKRPWRKTHGGFQGPDLEVRRTTSNHDPSPSTWSHGQLQEKLRNVLYLFAQKKTGNSQPITWQTNLKADPETMSRWPTKACWALFDPCPAPSLFWEMDSSHHKKSNFWCIQLLFRGQMLLTEQTPTLSCQQTKLCPSFLDSSSRRIPHSVK